MEYQIYLKGYVGGFDFDANYVDWILNNKFKGKHVDVLISSTGGSLDTALKISAAFRMHGDVHVHFVGFNASAATIASMGAKHITMESCAFYLVHQCSQEIFLWDDMNKEDLQKLKDNIDKTIADLTTIDEQISALYASKTSKDINELTELMKKGGWLNAQQAKEWGFVDEIKDTEEVEPQQLSDGEIAAMVKNGMPAPPQANKKNSLIKAIVEEIKNILKPNNTTKMNFANIEKLLDVQDFTVKDGVISLSVEQMTRINEALNNQEENEYQPDETDEHQNETAEAENLDDQTTADTAPDSDNCEEPAEQPTQQEEQETETQAETKQVVNNGTTTVKTTSDYFKTRKNAQELYNLLK